MNTVILRYCGILYILPYCGNIIKHVNLHLLHLSNHIFYLLLLDYKFVLGLLNHHIFVNYNAYNWKISYFISYLNKIFFIYTVLSEDCFAEYYQKSFSSENKYLLIGNNMEVSLLWILQSLITNFGPLFISSSVSHHHHHWYKTPEWTLTFFKIYFHSDVVLQTILLVFLVTPR